MQILRADRFGQPFFRLGISCLFHLGDFRFHSFYQLCELFLAFFSCLCVDILGDAFAIHSRCEPSLVEVVVYHGDASRATLAYLALVELKFLLRSGFRGGGFTCLGRLHALCEFGHFCVCTANLSVDSTTSSMSPRKMQLSLSLIVRNTLGLRSSRFIGGESEDEKNHHIRNDVVEVDRKTKLLERTNTVSVDIK